MIRRLSIALVVMNLCRALFASPAEALAISLADVRTLAPADALRSRYLDMSGIPAADRAAALPVLAFWLNSLNRSEPEFGRFVILGDNQQVLRIDLADFGLWGDAKDPKAGQVVWERLASVDGGDPYFHRKLEEVSADGTKRRYLAHATWLPKADVEELANRTYSYVPIVRADWFLFVTSQQAGRGKRGQVPGYYDLLGLGEKSADFQRLIGANVGEARRLRLEMREVVRRSKVTQHNRAITRFQALSGGYFLTADFKTDVDKQNVLRLLNGETEPPNGDASEQIGVLPCRLFAWWLENSKGERQDAAPDFIASDQKGLGNDSRVHVGRSCIGCHVEGLRPIEGFARDVFSDEGQIRSVDKDTFLRLRRLYLSDLPGQLFDDRQVYAKALRRCNGLSPEENAAAFRLFYQHYAEDDVTVPIAAHELGCSADRLIQVLETHTRDRPGKTALADPILTGFAKVPSQPIRRETFEELFPVFMDLLGGVIP